MRAIKETYLEMEQGFQDKNYMIAGFGKVGQGICNSLIRAGVAKKQLFVIDVDEKHLSMARSADMTTFCLKKNKRDILTILSSARIDCVVTATGVKNTISQNFTVTDFNEVEILCNMGTDDEWGDHFSEERILNMKKPLNFMLTYPTKIKYLDPIFALLACSAVDLIKMESLDTFKILKPSPDTQKHILTLWLSKNEFYVKFVKEMNPSIEVLLD